MEKITNIKINNNQLSSEEIANPVVDDSINFSFSNFWDKSYYRRDKRIPLAAAATFTVILLVILITRQVPVDNQVEFTKPDFNTTPITQNSDNSPTEATDQALDEEDPQDQTTQESWVYFHDTVAGYRLNRPTSFKNLTVDGIKSISPISFPVHSSGVGDDTIQVKIIQATPDQSFAKSGFDLGTQTDSTFGTLNILGNSTKLKVKTRSQRAGGTGTGCKYSGYLENVYYTQLDPSTYIYFSIKSTNSCFSEENALEEDVQITATTYKPTLVKILNSITRISKTKTFNPIPNSTKFTCGTLTLKYPEGWNAYKLTELGDDSCEIQKQGLVIKVSPSTLSTPVPSPAISSSQVVTYLIKNKQAVVDEKWYSSCEDAQNPSECSTVTFESFPQDMTAEIYTSIPLPGFSGGSDLFIEVSATPDPSGASPYVDTYELEYLRNEAAAILMTLTAN